MKPVIDPVSGLVASAIGSARLRIAVPSWRFVGIDVSGSEVRTSVSREEILSLFAGELGSRRRRAKLTEREEREKALARSLRSALYPA